MNAHNRVEVTRLSELSLFSNCDFLLFLISIFFFLNWDMEMQAYCTVDGLQVDVMVNGIVAQNRAV